MYFLWLVNNLFLEQTEQNAFFSPGFVCIWMEVNETKSVMCLNFLHFNLNLADDNL